MTQPCSAQARDDGKVELSSTLGRGAGGVGGRRRKLSVLERRIVAIAHGHRMSTRALLKTIDVTPAGPIQDKLWLAAMTHDNARVALIRALSAARLAERKPILLKNSSTHRNNKVEQQRNAMVDRSVLDPVPSGGVLGCGKKLVPTREDVLRTGGGSDHHEIGFGAGTSARHVAAVSQGHPNMAQGGAL
jgi:hypothetical protein